MEETEIVEDGSKSICKKRNDGKPSKSKSKAKEDYVSCKFYIVSKKRYCRMRPTSEKDFCGEHMIHDFYTLDDPDKKRIPCPYNPNHTCFEKFLKEHMKKCNARPQTPEPYFCSGVNAVEGDDDTDAKNLADLSLEELNDLIEKVRTIHKKHTLNVEKKFGIHPILSSEVLSTSLGENALKHLCQNASLLSILDENNFINDSTCFIEFGSGRGSLSYWIGKASIEKKEKCNFILIDRRGYRHKKDGKLKENNLEVKRIRVDIQHLKIDMLDEIKNCKNIVGVTKHLCGEGTDFALRCLFSTNEKRQKIKGILFATCCHHSCNWNNYVGNQELESWGITKNEFKAFKGMASWATCGTGESRFKNIEDKDLIHYASSSYLCALNKYSELKLTIEERRKIGIMVKEIIDFGRIAYLKSFGLNGILCHYVDSETTYENGAILAF